jgi:hypothetical protein
VLSPLVYCKVVCARNAYLKTGNGKRKAAMEKLLDIAGDRYCFYKQDDRPNDARRILKLATTKGNATDVENSGLAKIRRKMLDDPCLAEKQMTA